MAQTDFLEEAELKNWRSVNSEPVIPGSIGAPPSPNDMAPYFQGSLAPNLQHDATFVGTKYGSPNIPQFPLIPIAASGSPSIQSAIQSGSSVQIVNNVSAVAAGANGQVQYNNGGALGASSAFTWDNINDVLRVLGIINAVTGFQVSGLAPSGNILIGNGTTFVSGSPATLAIWNTVSKNTTYSANAGDWILADTSGGGFTITIPLSSANANKSIRVKKISSDTNNLTIARSGGDLIDGQASQIITFQYTNIEIGADGITGWWIA